MQRSKIGKFIDNVFLTVALFIFNILIFNQIFKSYKLSIALSIVVSYIFIKLFLNIQNKRYSNLSIKNEEKKNIEQSNFYLRTLSKDQLIELFSKALNIHNLKIHSQSLIVDHNLLILFSLEKDQLKPEDIFYCNMVKNNICSSLKINIIEAVVICNSLSQEAQSYINKFGFKITIFSPIETYAFLKKYDITTPTNESKKIKTFFLKNAFIHSKGRNFIKCGAFLYLTSLLVPFTKYYLITASILMLVGCFCLCFCEKTPPINTLSKQILL